MKSLDTCNERAPEKFTEKRRSFGSLKREPMLPRVSEHSNDAEAADETTSDSIDSPCPRGTLTVTAQSSIPQTAR